LIIEDNSIAGCVRRFSLLDGHETTGPASVSGLNLPCAAGWADSTVTLPIHDNVTATTAIVRDGQSRAVVAVEPAVGARCFIWAEDALSGEGYGGLLGTSTGW
jgi:hypothetical protein